MFKDRVQNFDQETLVKYLQAEGVLQQELLDFSRIIKEQTFGRKVWFRGLIEFSNICQNNCYYCGIRKDNEQNRFKISHDEILECLKFINKANYGSVVYQSGEVNNNHFKEYLLKIVELTHEHFPHLGITVSAGEFDYEFYKKLKDAGANRYLLRIESSNKELYKKMHPAQMSWDRRFECLKDLQTLGYQTGTGTMVGVPGQTIDDLINDLKFFVKHEFDMFGIGPYVVHEDTPFGQDPEIRKWWHENKEKNYNLFLNFMAILRILRPNVNIAAATASDVFDPLGRIKVLQIAGTVIMPSVTPKDYRNQYFLYQGKPGVDEGADKSFDQLTNKIINAGLTPAFGEHGDSPFYHQKYGKA